MKEIKAREGYYLTQSDDLCLDRMFITALKGVNINDKDWKEVTIEEKEEYEKIFSNED